MQAAAQSYTASNVSTIGWPVRFMPSLADFAFLLPGLLLFTRMPGSRVLFSDGDTGWHIRAGEWILQHARVPTHDLFSFTKPQAPWFAWEWGWDALFALIHSRWGLGGVGFVSVLLLGLSSVLLYRLVVRACANEVLGFFVTTLAVCGGTGHWLARPHLFSWIFFLLFLHLLHSAQQGRKRALLWLPPLMLLWTNLHGAFFIGIAAILTAALAVAIETAWPGLPAQTPPLALTRPAASFGPALLKLSLVQAKPYLLCAGACLAATFINPYTWRLHRHIAAYLSDPQLLDNIQEFQSVSFHGGQSIFFEVMLLASGAAMLSAWRARQLAPALLMLCWAHLALVSARNVPFFLMVSAPPLAVGLQRVLTRPRDGARGAPALAAVREICQEFSAFERVRRVHLLSALGVLTLAFLFASGRPGFEGEFNPESFPRQAIPVIEASAARRIFASDQWGDYLIYRLYPARRVFVDGRSDFYGAPFVLSALHTAQGRFDWRGQLTRFAVDMVIVRPDAPLSTILKTAPGWKILFDDGKVLIFAAETRLRMAGALPKAPG